MGEYPIYFRMTVWGLDFVSENGNIVIFIQFNDNGYKTLADELRHSHPKEFTYLSSALSPSSVSSPCYLSIRHHLFMFV